ncbi:MAG: radical SAM protein, partial [Ruminococcus flavefaciens]|nr:radical SAM protein [Ruminococcus flavefaciens]
MRVFNFRQGFANNSSSSHNTLVNADGRPLEESLPLCISRLTSGGLSVEEFAYFGWEDFVLTSRDAKLLYLAFQIFSALHKFPKSAVLGFVLDVLPELSGVLSTGSYDVDHQSCWALPIAVKTPHSEFPDREFLLDMKEYLSRDDVVIFGGNDNTYDETDLPSQAGMEDSALEFIPRSDSLYFSKKEGDVWTLFNRETGDKVRFSFHDDAYSNESETPELVDLIVSDQCSHNCSFCYRGCSSSGEVASLETVTTLISSISELGVFEIVIGGGDILSLPYLDELCQHIRNHNRFTAFTTTLFLTPLSLRDASIRRRFDLVIDTFSSIAISSTNTDNFDLASYIQLTSSTQTSLQIVPELESQTHLESLLSFLSFHNRIPLTLLGFKPTCRGQSHVDNLNDSVFVTDLVVHLIDAKVRLGVDTAFVQRFPKIMKVFDSRLYYGNEGKFSCCVDA